jgi:hypothetical protein
MYFYDEFKLAASLLQVNVNGQSLQTSNSVIISIEESLECQTV